MPATPRTTTERSVASCLPYSQQIDEHTVITHEGDLTQTIRVHGLSFDTMGHKDLDSFNQQWFTALNNMARSPNVALWTHIEHRRVRYDTGGVVYDNAFSTQFAREYDAKFEKEKLFLTELFVSPVYRLAANKADRMSIRMAKKNSDSMVELREKAREEMNKVSMQLMSTLKRYHPRRLGTYTAPNGDLCTRIGEFYCHLLNNTTRQIELQRTTLSQNIQTSYLNFGTETLEIEGPARSQYAAVLTLVAPYGGENPDLKVFEELLSAPFEFTLSQSITVMPFDKADSSLKAQYNKIKSTSGNEDQLKEIADARKNLQANKFSMLEHEFILVIYGDTVKELNDNVNSAVTTLNRKSMLTSREKGGALIATFMSIMPANFKYGRMRAMPISSKNFSKFFPIHNHPTGNARGSQWGPPVMLMKTAAGSPYFFNFHVSRNRLEEQGVKLDYAEEAPSRDETGAGGKRKKKPKELGNYQIIGRSGGGKTVLKTALRAMSRRIVTQTEGRRLKSFIWDKDYGEEIAIRALGGKYFRIAAGKPTMMNMFWMDPTPENIQMIYKVMVWNAQFESTYRLTNRDTQDLLHSIKRVFSLDMKDRRYRRVTDALANHEDDSLYNSLLRWCYDGPYAWILDSPSDNFDLKGADTFGFDMTNFLDIPEARTPILTYVNHRIAQEADGSPFIIDIAEAWRALKDPMLQAFIEDQGKTIRKQNGVMGLDTQEPSDISKSPLGSTLLSQFPTQLILPNNQAEAADYIDGLHLTPREFHLVQNTEEGTGQFLVKKGAESVLVRMDLSGMDDMLAVLSGDKTNVEIMHEVMREVGEDPADWLPIFLKRRV